MKPLLALCRRAASVVLGLSVCCSMSQAAAQTFDFDHGNAPVDVIIPAVVPVVFANVSKLTGTHDVGVRLELVAV